MIKIKPEDIVERCGIYPSQKVLDETVIVEPRARLMHNLNEVGSDIWEVLTQPRTVQEVIDLITEEYKVDYTMAQADIIRFLQEMIKRNLIKVKA